MLYMIYSVNSFVNRVEVLIYLFRLSMDKMDNDTVKWIMDALSYPVIGAEVYKFIIL